MALGLLGLHLGVVRYQTEELPGALIGPPDPLRDTPSPVDVRLKKEKTGTFTDQYLIKKIESQEKSARKV